MTNYQRIHVDRVFTLPVKAEDYWAMLVDWAGVLDWMPSENPPVRLKKVELKAGHGRTSLPRTRVVHQDKSQLPPELASVVPDVMEETLLHADDAARTILFNIEGIGPFGMRNYLCTMEIDAIGDQQCEVRFFGRVDLPVDGPRELIEAFVADIYERGIAGGIADTIQRQRAA